jgi:hypothetical protein
MVGGAVAHPAATSEPRLKVFLHAAPQYMGLCHRHPMGCLLAQEQCTVVHYSVRVGWPSVR